MGSNVGVNQFLLERGSGLAGLSGLGLLGWAVSYFFSVLNSFSFFQFLFLF